MSNQKWVLVLAIVFFCSCSSEGIASENLEEGSILSSMVSSSLSISSSKNSSSEESVSSSSVLIEPNSSTKVIGYFMNWRSSLADNSIEGLTHLILTGLKLDATSLDGSLDSSAGNMLKHLPILKEQTDRIGTKLMIMVGGWGSEAGFSEAAASEVNRKHFASSLASFCKDHGLAGADIDWEFPAADEFENFELMVKELRTEFDKHSLLLTAAVGQDHGDKFTKGTWQYLDWVNIMAYDMNWAKKGQAMKNNHAPLDLAETHLPKWEGHGVPKSKLVLGLPFYARLTLDWGDAKAYSEIYDSFTPLITDNEAGGYNYNGPQTLYDKTKYVIENKYAGVMIWEIAHDLDYSHEASLLRYLNKAILDSK